jgi:uncharacterized Tic20 family protein
MRDNRILTKKDVDSIINTRIHQTLNWKVATWAMAIGTVGIIGVGLFFVFTGITITAAMGWLQWLLRILFVLAIVSAVYAIVYEGITWRKNKEFFYQLFSAIDYE